MSGTFEGLDLEALDRELIGLRRELHRFPEAAWTEFYTTARLIRELEGLGLTVLRGPALHTPEYRFGLPDGDALAACMERAAGEGADPALLRELEGGFTGCAAVVEGALPGPSTALRVDIDCVNVQESAAPSHLPGRAGFASRHPGLMHACAHDGHAAMGIGAARLLLALRDRLRGRVLLIFQPGEEGVRGGKSVARSGLLDGVDYLLGVHIGLGARRVGTVAAGCHGMLATTKLDFTFKGEAAHAGLSPELGRNALAAASAAVLNLLAIPRHGGGASRINVGTLRAGAGRNVIPDWAVLEAETRGATNEIDAYMAESAGRVCRAAAQMYGCDCGQTFQGQARSAACDPALVRSVLGTLRSLPEVDEPLEDIDFGGSEDVSHLMLEVQRQGGKATELVVGSALAAPHHSGSFDFDERSIGLGARVLAKAALDLSNRPV